MTKRFRWGLAASIIGAAAGFGGTAASQETSGFRAVHADGTAVEVPTLRVDAGGRSEPLTFYVTQAGEEAVAATLMAPTLSFEPAKIMVPPAGARTAVTVTAAAGPQALQVIDVNITATDTGASSLLFRAQIVRASLLELVSHSATGVTEESWPVRDYTGSVRLRSNGAQPLMVSVAVDPLAVPGGHSTTLDISVAGAGLASGDTLALQPGQRLDLVLAAALEQAGTYRSRIELRTGTAPETILSIPVSIKRTSVAPTLTIDAPASARVTDGEEAVIRIEGRETGGRAVQIKRFTVVKTRVDNGATGGARDAGNLSFSVHRDGADVTAGTTVGPHEPFSLVVRIPGLDDSGTVTASLRLTDPGSEVVEVPFTVLVKDDLILPTVAVAVGVGLSALFAWLGGTALAWARRRAHAATLGERINIVLRDEPVPAQIAEAAANMTSLLRAEVYDVRGAMPFGAADRADKRLKISERHATLLPILLAAWRVLAQDGNPLDTSTIAEAIALISSGGDNEAKENEYAAALSKLVASRRTRAAIEIAAWAETQQATTSRAPDVLAALGLLPPAPAVGADDRPERWRPDATGAFVAWRGLQFVVWIIVGIATVLLGLFALYLDDPTWGGWRDVAIAVLWGLGITASGVTGAAGVTNIRKSVGLGAADAT